MTNLLDKVSDNKMMVLSLIKIDDIHTQLDHMT